MRTLQSILDEVSRSAGHSFGTGVISVHSERVDGETALHIMAKWGDVEAIRTLVENGAAIDKRGEDGNTPLHYAAMFGNYQAAQCLVELGAKCLKDVYGNSPSALATDGGEVYAWLQEHGF